MRVLALAPVALLLALAVFFVGPAWEIAPERIGGAILLLLLAGTVLLAIRLLLFRPEAVALAIGLSAVFLTGFTAALVQGDRDWQGWEIEVGAIGLALTASTILLTGWLANTRWSAALACGVFIPLSWIVAILGAYATYATGWRGLDISTFGSDDQPGLTNAAVTFVLATPFWSVMAILAGAIGWFVNSFRPRGDEPPAQTPVRETGPQSTLLRPPPSEASDQRRFRLGKRPARRGLVG